jgi:hypothetical protein
MTQGKDRRSHRSNSDGVSSRQPSHRRKVKRSKRVYPGFNFFKKLTSYCHRTSLFREIESFDRLNKECMVLFPAAFTSTLSSKQLAPKEQPKFGLNTKTPTSNKTQISTDHGNQVGFSTLNSVLVRNKHCNGQLHELDASMSRIVQSLQRHRYKDEGNKFLQFIANSENQLERASSFNNLLAGLLNNDNDMTAEFEPQSEPSDRLDFLQQEIDLLHERDASERLSEEMDEQRMLESATDQPTWLFQMFVEGQHSASVDVDEIEHFQ